MKRQNSFIGVTPYALLLYMLYTDEDKLAKTVYYVGKHLLDCNLPNKIYMPDVTPYTTRSLIQYRLKCLKYRFSLMRTNIYAQDHLSFSAALIDNLTYTELEDCPNYFSVLASRAPKEPPFIPCLGSYIYNIKVGRIFNRYGGFNPWCVNRIVTSTPDVHFFGRLGLRCEQVNLSQLWKEASASKRQFIQDVYSLSDVEKLISKKVVVFSQPLVKDAYMSCEEFATLYKPYIDKYGIDNILVKIHPRDDFDYEKYFPGITTLKTKAPQQLLSAMGIKFKTAITVCSSAVSSMDEDCEIVWIGAEVDDRIVKAYGHVKSPSNYK